MCTTAKRNSCRVTIRHNDARSQQIRIKKAHSKYKKVSAFVCTLRRTWSKNCWDAKKRARSPVSFFKYIFGATPVISFCVHPHQLPRPLDIFFFTSACANGRTCRTQRILDGCLTSTQPGVRSLFSSRRCNFFCLTLKLFKRRRRQALWNLCWERITYKRGADIVVRWKMKPRKEGFKLLTSL